MPSTSEHSDSSEANRKGTPEVGVDKTNAIAVGAGATDETQSNTSGVKSTVGGADDGGKGLSGSNASADDEREPTPTKVKTRVVPTVEPTQNATLSAPHKRGGANRIAAAMQALSWDQSDVTGDSQQAGVGDFTRGTEGGSAPKGKRGGRRSTDSDGRRRRSGDSEGGRRRKSGDNEGRRRRSGDARRSSDSRKSGEHRRSGESRRNSESQGSAPSQPEGEQLPQITDVLLARLITSLSDSTLGNPALLLQSLLGFSPDDYNDLLAALSESRLSYVDIIAAYLHNIRVMSEDSGSSSAALSGTLTRSLIEQYNNLLVQALKSPRPAMKAGAAGNPLSGMMVKPPMPPSMAPNPRSMGGTTGADAGLPRGPSGLGFGRRSLDSLRQQRQNFAMTSIGMPSAAQSSTKPVPRPGQRKSYSGEMPANPNGFQAPPPPPYQQGAPPPPAYASTPTPPPFPSTPPPPYGGPGVPAPPPFQATPPPPTYAATPAATVFPTAPPPGFQTTPPAPVVTPQAPQQILPEQYATYLSNARLASMAMVQGMTPRLVNNPMLAGSPGLDFGGPGLVAGVAGISVPSNWRSPPPVMGTQQEISSWPQTQPAAANPGQTCAPGWHGTLPVVQEHERMDQNAGYQTG